MVIFYCGESYSTDGNITNNHGGGDFWIVKLSDVGTIEWEKSLGGGYSEIANGITQTTDGGYILTGGNKIC